MRVAPAILAAFCAATGSAAEPAPFAAVLDRIGGRVQSFWGYFPGVACTESVFQAKLDAKGKVLSERKTTYDYLALLDSSGNRISVEESRVEKTGSRSKGSATLLTTSGFSILSLIFHPIYQSSYEFSAMPRDAAAHNLTRVAFRHLNVQDRTPSVLVLHGREYPLDWKGVAWIDSDSGEVVRIQTSLENSMEDIGLLGLETDVTYEPVHFTRPESTYWLPVRAVIQAATRRQSWRNTHLFGAYRRFNVETEVRTETVK